MRGNAIVFRGNEIIYVFHMTLQGLRNYPIVQPTYYSADYKINWPVEGRTIGLTNTAGIR